MAKIEKGPGFRPVLNDNEKPRRHGEMVVVLEGFSVKVYYHCAGCSSSYSQSVWQTEHADHA